MTEQIPSYCFIPITKDEDELPPVPYEPNPRAFCNGVATIFATNPEIEFVAIVEDGRLNQDPIPRDDTRYIPELGD